jgi:hypothetical protein
MHQLRWFGCGSQSKILDERSDSSPPACQLRSNAVCAFAHHRQRQTTLQTQRHLHFQSVQCAQTEFDADACLQSIFEVHRVLRFRVLRITEKRHWLERGREVCIGSHAQRRLQARKPQGLQPHPEAKKTCRSKTSTVPLAILQKTRA